MKKILMGVKLQHILCAYSIWFGWIKYSLLMVEGATGNYLILTQGKGLIILVFQITSKISKSYSSNY